MKWDQDLRRFLQLGFILVHVFLAKTPKLCFTACQGGPTTISQVAHSKMKPLVLLMKLEMRAAILQGCHSSPWVSARRTKSGGWCFTRSRAQLVSVRHCFLLLPCQLLPQRQDISYQPQPFWQAEACSSCQVLVKSGSLWSVRKR